MKNILVAGDLIQDIFIYGTSDRINPEGPFPLVSQSYTEEKLGGVGNVLNNLISLGIEPIFVYPNEKNISTKTRIAVNNRIIFRYDNDVYSEEYLTPENFDTFDLSGIEYVILSDYNKGFLREVSPVIKMLNDKGCKVIVDPKQTFNVYKGAWCIKPNQKEFEEFYGPVTKENIRKFAAINQHKLVIITMGDKGLVYYYQGIYFEKPAIKNQVADVTGAGDCFLAAFAYGLMKDMTVPDAIKIANIGAGISVQHLGTYNLKPSDLIKTVVFTNGCFDILHRGHIELLETSKSYGDYLIVGLNSDESIKRLKGETRPIMNQEDRKRTLECLKFVDEVIIFDEDTPYNLIKQIKPDIITKGGDYKIDEVVGNDLARVIIIPYVNGHSTSNILTDIKKNR
jgi:D-beta-D-heptose 7-phosphate kinase/D-beta-D-heptose 1-phosphate adenosyltransferase